MHILVRGERPKGDGDSSGPMARQICALVEEWCSFRKATHPESPTCRVSLSNTCCRQAGYIWELHNSSTLVPPSNGSTVTRKAALVICWTFGAQQRRLSGEFLTSQRACCLRNHVLTRFCGPAGGLDCGVCADGQALEVVPPRVECLSSFRKGPSGSISTGRWRQHLLFQVVDRMPVRAIGLMDMHSSPVTKSNCIMSRLPTPCAFLEFHHMQYRAR